MSPNVEYSPELVKKDPLTTLHIKVPKSIVPIFNREGAERVRAASFVMREVLVSAAQKLAVKHEDIDRRTKLAQTAQKRKAS